MEFRDFQQASAYYASRYVEYAAGRLPPERLDAERRALVVLDARGARWVMDQAGQWVPGRATTNTNRTGFLVAAGGLAAGVVLLLVVGLVARDGGRQSGLPDSPAVAPTAQSAAPAAPAPGLAGVLQQGGVVVYLRHAERAEEQEEVTDARDCSQQANLTTTGQAEAQRTGAALRALGVQVATVTASPYCRTRETAALAFGREPVLVQELSGASLLPPIPEQEQRAALLALLTTAPPAGQVAFVVGHGEVLQALVGGEGLGFAELAVFRPEAGSATALGQLTHEQLVAVGCASGRC